MSLEDLLSEVATERSRQDSIFGIQKLPDGTGGGGRKTWEIIARNWCDRATREGILTFADILDEETAEALAETDPVKLRIELVQVAAVALKWVQDLDRRAAVGGVVLPEDPAIPPPDVIAAMAENCRSCAECGGEAAPCATCMAGGVCTASCRCGESEDHDDPDDDCDPSACPGCGGSCQVACR